MSNSTTRHVLVMDFYNQYDEPKSIRVSDPKEDLDSATIQAAMELITDLNVFANIFAGRMKGAKTVQTTTSNFDIVVS